MLLENFLTITSPPIPLRVLHGCSAGCGVQAVVPVILVKPIDTLPRAFVNILPPTKILTRALANNWGIYVSRVRTEKRQCLYNLQGVGWQQSPTYRFQSLKLHVMESPSICAGRFSVYSKLVSADLYYWSCEHVSMETRLDFKMFCNSAHLSVVYI